MSTPTRALKQPNWQVIEHVMEMGGVWHFVSGKTQQQQMHGIQKRWNYRQVLLQDPCVYCRSRKPKGLDHIVPHVKGGRNGWQNRAPACTHCDQHKGSKDLIRYLIIKLQRSKSR